MLDELKPHLVELRARLINSVVSLFIGFCISFFFWEQILEWMTYPLKSVLPKNGNIIFTEVGESFFTAVKVSIFSAFIISLPVIFTQIWFFVAPGLYENEKKIAIPFVLCATLMFILGALFAYYVVFPYGFSYLINFGSVLFAPLLSIGSYVSFFAKLMIGFGLAFELPIITFFLGKLGLIDENDLKSFFKYAIIIIFVLASILTPPDVVTQILMSLPLILLYGASIYIVKFTK